MKQQNLFGQPVVEDPIKVLALRARKNPRERKRPRPTQEKIQIPSSRHRWRGRSKGQGIRGPRQPGCANGRRFSGYVEFRLPGTRGGNSIGGDAVDGSSPPVETEVDTQPGTETQTEEEETQPETQIDEDDGEPVSRPAQSGPCPRADRWKWHSIRLLVG
jgi:hypothetical protein